jgi:hypothetical protein
MSVSRQDEHFNQTDFNTVMKEIYSINLFVATRYLIKYSNLSCSEYISAQFRVGGTSIQE